MWKEREKYFSKLNTRSSYFTRKLKFKESSIQSAIEIISRELSSSQINEEALYKLFKELELTTGKDVANQ